MRRFSEFVLLAILSDSANPIYKRFSESLYMM